MAATNAAARAGVDTAAASGVYGSLPEAHQWQITPSHATHTATPVAVKQALCTVLPHAYTRSCTNGRWAQPQK